MKRLCICFMLLVIIMMAVPVVGQEDVVTQETMQEGWLDKDFIFAGLLVIALAAWPVVAYAIRQISNSAPVWMIDLIKPVIEQGFTQLELIADGTDTPMDNDAIAELRERLEALELLYAQKDVEADVPDVVEIN